MDAEKGKDLRTGGMPALNIERIYSTTVPAEELAGSSNPVRCPRTEHAGEAAPGRW